MIPKIHIMPLWRTSNKSHYWEKYLIAKIKIYILYIFFVTAQKY